MKKVISTKNAPAAIGPYSQAIRVGQFIFVSGQLPIDPNTGLFSGEDISSQTKQSLENIKAILQCEGASLTNVVRSGVFLKNMENFAEMNRVYSEYFTSDYPGRAAVEVARLPKDALVEIEVIAYINDK